MESTGETISGDATVVRSNAPSDFLMSSRSETSNPPPTSVAPPPPPPPQNSFAPITLPPATEGFSTGLVKKKRGRPRKYGHDGAPVALSPVPISSAAPTSSPHVLDFSAASEKRSKVKPATSTSFIKTNYQADNLGNWAPSLVGANFTPHIITVNAGEDVTKKIISFSQRGSFAVCVLCANGAVSSVTLRQPDSSGGTLTYEGRFEILSLSGSFMPSDSDGTRSRTGGMTVSLASPNGRVVGGGVAGVLIAATPIQVVVGSFLAGTNQQDQQPNQHNHSFISSPMPTSSNRPMSSSSLHISTWTPTFSSDPQHKPSHDINIALT
ncbi:unnamed protein product [Microthlaspi erraticum]|uniref:AT-hook motif nuclear-localized protein n=1 Tax=Microthlaspi erraticum TaxID=1685480 RepID=A0A6D2L380_9BRAS|nr:unnamed protein product [Microthlaspi erraticum]